MCDKNSYILPIPLKCDHINKRFYFKIGQCTTAVALKAFDVVSKMWHFTPQYLTAKMLKHQQKKLEGCAILWTWIKTGAEIVIYCSLCSPSFWEGIGYHKLTRSLYGVLFQREAYKKQYCVWHTRETRKWHMNHRNWATYGEFYISLLINV